MPVSAPALPRVALGRTGLRVAPAGLGCGGHSRLGLARGGSAEAAADVVRRALDLGVDLVDTAAAYGTEEVVGRALAGRRDGVVLSTKVSPEDAGGPRRPAALRAAIEESLRRLGTDRIDVFHLHGVVEAQYRHCREVLVPELLRAREAGLVRFLGITERFVADPGHALLERALSDDCWDVVMVGFNLLNPSARGRVLARTQPAGVGTLVMFAVRRALSQPEALAPLLRELHARGEVPDDVLRPDPLGFLVSEGGAESVVDAAYRFCRHEPGVDVVLTGTGSAAHLAENLRSLARGPLAAPARERLRALFGRVDSVSAN